MLALALGGRTIAEWQKVMSAKEAEAWREFYVAYPFDDRHRYHRPAALNAAMTGGGGVQKMLDWLEPEPTLADMSEADIATMRALGFVRKFQGGA